MLPPQRALLTALSRFRPRPMWWLGRPYRVTIAAAASGGYLLLIHHTQGTEWIELPTRTEPYDHPDEREFSAAADALAARRLAWVLPWQLDANGSLTAPITTLTGPDGSR
jgi:hypothetical protein